MTDARARALLTRLGTFLDQFTRCFGRQAHRTYASRYLQGLLNDSERKSMQPMHGRLSDPGSYQGLQHIDLQMTVDDAKTFTRVWTIATELIFDPDTDLLEYVCNENEKSRQYFVQPSSTGSAEIRVDPAVLSKDVGLYEIMTPRGLSKATVSLEGDQLMIDVPGRGSGRMVPQSATMFLFLGVSIEFVPNDHGEVTHLMVHVVEGDFKGPRLR